jgi:hypothetical protein
MLGGGEYNRMTRTYQLGGRPPQQSTASTDFDIFA